MTAELKLSFRPLSSARGPTTSSAKTPGSAALMWLALAAPSIAGQCDGQHGQHLKSMQATFFNSYYFSTVDDPDRCLNLQSAIVYQQQLVAWLESCDHGNVANARADLSRLGAISPELSNCRP